MSDLDDLRSLQPEHIVVVIIPETNRVGALYEVLGEVLRAQININSLISRPIKGVDDMYSFFLTLESRVDDNLLECLRVVHSNRNFVRILGGYID
jgi:prephenate dehydratase